MKYRCMIVDDEPLAHDVMIHYISFVPELTLIARFFNTSEARQYLYKNEIDILLLDIKMPGENGLQFLQKLNQRPITLMTTAFRDYAIEGFDLGVLDYLIKPIKKERFEQGIHRAIEILELTRKNPVILEEPTTTRTSFTIKSGTKLISLDLHSITHIQGLKDYSILYTIDAKYVIKGYIKNVEKMMPESQFIRVHKSFIVANNLIKTIDKNKIKLNHHQIPIGRMYKKMVEELFQ